MLLCRERVPAPKDENNAQSEGSEDANAQSGQNKANYSDHSLLKSASISGSKCIGIQPKTETAVSFLITHVVVLVNIRLEVGNKYCST